MNWSLAGTYKSEVDVCSPRSVPSGSAMCWGLTREELSVILCLGSKMASCWSTRAPFSYQNMKNGFVLSVLTVWWGCVPTWNTRSRPRRALHPAGHLLWNHQNVTYSPWHCCADLQTSQLFPSKFLCHAMKTRGMSPLCSWAFPLRPNTHVSKNIKNHVYLQIGEARGLQLWKMGKKRCHWDWGLCFQAFNSHLWSQSWNFLITLFYCKMSLTIYDIGCLLLDLFLLWGIL